MELYRKQTSANRVLFLVLTDPDPKFGEARGVIVDLQKQTVQRIRSVPLLLRREVWQPLNESDLTLEALVERVPALRPFRGIEIRLGSGETAWVRWRQWYSKDSAVQKKLALLTGEIVVPAYEPDVDYFLAVQAVSSLGGEVLDSPRAVTDLGAEAY